MRFLIPILISFLYVNHVAAQRLMPIIADHANNGPDVNALIEYDGKLIIAGRMVDIMGQGRRNILGWDGSQFDLMQTAFNGNTDWIYDAIEFNGDLIVAGKDADINNVAAWNGTSWSAMGDGLNDRILTLDIFNGELYAGGRFDSSGTQAVSHVAKWNGTQWVQAGDGLNQVVSSLEVHNDTLYAGGGFWQNVQGNVVLRSIAKLASSQWMPVSGGLNGGVSQLLSTDNGLLIDGSFSFDMDSTIELEGFAIFTGSFQPVIHLGDTLSYPRRLFRSESGHNYISFDEHTICLDTGSPYERLEYGRIHSMIEYNGELIIGGGFLAYAYEPVKALGKILPGNYHPRMEVARSSVASYPLDYFFPNNYPYEPNFEVPNGSGNTTIYYSGTRMVGKVNGITYGDEENLQDIYPVGPIGIEQNTEFFDRYFQVWHITANMINEHINSWNDPNYVMPYAFLSWPGNGNILNGEAEILAPFVDLNANLIYEPQNGEFPLIRGDEALYHIYHNHKSSPISDVDSLIEAELHLMQYGFNSPWNEAIHNSIFVNIKAINRSNTNYDSTRVAIITDFDIGSPWDDFVACNPDLNMSYGFNGDSLDEGSGGYGQYPPAQGVKFLNRAMDTHIYENDFQNWPNKFWNDMNGLDDTGLPYIDTCSGITHYMFPGDPVTGTCWNELSYGNFPGDRRSLSSIPMQTFGSGDTICLDIAYIFAQDTAGDNLTSITLLRQYAQEVQDWYDQQNPDCSGSYGWVTAVDENEELGSIKLYPNPTGGMLTIEGQFNGKAELEIYSMSGRLVEKRTLNGHSEKSTVDLSALNNGIYLVVLRTEDQLFTERLIKLSY